jgi:hypothetical protein
MCFLKRNNTGEFSLTKDLVSDHDDIPCYATWGADAEEVSFKDMMDGTAMSKSVLRRRSQT